MLTHYLYILRADSGWKGFLGMKRIRGSLLIKGRCTSANNTLKSVLAERGQSFEEAKAHSFTGASAARWYSSGARFRNVLSAER